MNLKRGLVKASDVLPQKPDNNQRKRLYGLSAGLINKLGEEAVTKLLEEIYPALKVLPGFSPEGFFRGLQSCPPELLHEVAQDILEFCQKRNIDISGIPEYFERYEAHHDKVTQDGVRSTRFTKTSGHHKARRRHQEVVHSASEDLRHAQCVLKGIHDKVVACVPEAQTRKPLFESTYPQRNAIYSDPVYQAIIKVAGRQGEYRQRLYDSKNSLTTLALIEKARANIQGINKLERDVLKDFVHVRKRKPFIGYEISEQARIIGRNLSATAMVMANPYGNKL